MLELELSDAGRNWGSITNGCEMNFGVYMAKLVFVMERETICDGTGMELIRMRQRKCR